MMKTQTKSIIAAVLILLLLAAIWGLEQVLPSSSIVFTVLRKGAIYSLIAVSLNLLNGFTGLFSLGHAGFMLIGAYTYAILTIPMSMRDSVYMYYDGGIIDFALPVPVALLLAGVVAGLFGFLIGLPVLRLKSD